ncbi:MAG TPA: 50S ribosomal protein L11 methyltransferase [Rhizomicrobium sp.]|jgi:ribosomal protein L11 methyltransferase
MIAGVPVWKASVRLLKERAGDMAALFEITPPRPQAVLIDEEPFGKHATVEALYGIMPDGNLLSKLADADIRVALIPDQDWIRLSQEGLPPVRAGRFFVYGAHDQGTVPGGVIPLRIEAGLAFGTGHHESTAMCLALLSDLAKRRRFRRALDLGCGTGVLAIAIAKLWRRRTMAADIDRIAVGVAHENATLNGARTLVRTVAADGLAHPALSTRFDLVVANILAGPLTHLAPQIVLALAPRATLILSGILAWQENLVLGFYRPHGLVLCEKRRDGNWSALLLERRGPAG